MRQGPDRHAAARPPASLHDERPVDRQCPIHRVHQQPSLKGAAKLQARSIHKLREELRQKYIEMQRAKNPNYGTVLNMGGVWSDQ